MGLLPCRRDETLQAGNARPDNLLAAELVTRELQEQRRLLMFQGPFHQPHSQGIEIQRGGSAKAQMGLDLLEVERAGGNPAAIGGERVRRHGELLRDIDDRVPRGRAEVVRGKPQIAQGTELHGKAQAGVRLALFVDRGLIGVG